MLVASHGLSLFLPSLHTEALSSLRSLPLVGRLLFAVVFVILSVGERADTATTR